MDSQKKHLGQSLSMAALLVLTSLGFVGIISMF